MIVTSKITNLDEISDFITLFIFREVALNLKNTELRKIFYVYIHWYKHPNRMFFDQFFSPLNTGKIGHSKNV